MVIWVLGTRSGTHIIETSLVQCNMSTVTFLLLLWLVVIISSILLSFFLWIFRSILVMCWYKLRRRQFDENLRLVTKWCYKSHCMLGQIKWTWLCENYQTFYLIKHPHVAIFKLSRQEKHSVQVNVTRTKVQKQSANLEKGDKRRNKSRYLP